MGESETPGKNPVKGPQEMTEEEIVSVFETLNLPTVPFTAAPPEAEPLILFKVTGDTPPQDAH